MNTLSPLDSKSVSDLVELHDGKAVTDSLKIAEVFDRQHKDVLRTIKTLECSKEFSLRNFASSDFETERGKIYNKYEMTRDGFTFLAMGFTGRKAAQWKERYIEAFNRMEEQLHQPTPQTPNTASLDQLTNYLQTRLMDGRLIHGTTLELQQLLRIVENLNGVENGYSVPKLPALRAPDELPFGFRQLLSKSAKLSDQLRDIEATIENARRINAALYSEIECDLLVANGAKVVEEPKQPIQNPANQLISHGSSDISPAIAISPPQKIELSASGIPYFRAGPQLYRWFRSWLAENGYTQARFCREHQLPVSSMVGALSGHNKGPRGRRLKTKIKKIVQEAQRNA